MPGYRGSMTDGKLPGRIIHADSYDPRSVSPNEEGPRFQKVKFYFDEGGHVIGWAGDGMTVDYHASEEFEVPSHEDLEQYLNLHADEMIDLLWSAERHQGRDSIGLDQTSDPKMFSEEGEAI